MSNKKLLSFAQLKRDASSGRMALVLVQRYGKTIPKEEQEVCPVVEVHAKSLGLRRRIKNSNGEIEEKVSTLDLDYASLIEYDGKTLKVFDMGLRPLNDLEQRVMNGWKKRSSTKEYKERAHIDVMTDGSSTFCEEQLYFNNSPCPYLFGTQSGKRLDLNTGMVFDPKIKGKCILSYHIATLGSNYKPIEVQVFAK